MSLPLPGEKPKRRTRARRAIASAAGAVPPKVWAAEKVARVIAPYLVLAIMAACIIRGGGPAKCLGSACTQLGSLIPGAIASTTATPGATPATATNTEGR